MDIIKAYKIKQRICTANKDCATCPIANKDLDKDCDIDKFPSVENINDIQQLVQILQEWDEQHPITTAQDKLKKLFPDVPLDEEGIAYLCPRAFYKNYKCEYLRQESDCKQCRQKFWQQEVDDE